MNRNISGMHTVYGGMS